MDKGNRRISIICEANYAVIFIPFGMSDIIAAAIVILPFGQLYIYLRQMLRKAQGALFRLRSIRKIRVSAGRLIPVNFCRKNPGTAEADPGSSN